MCLGLIFPVEFLLKEDPIFQDSEKETQMKHLYQQMGKDNINWEIVVNICKNYPFMREWQ